MKTKLLICFLIFCFSFFVAEPSSAQCSICTKTTQQLGEKPAKGMNTGILYLAFAPFIIVGFVAFRWWKKHKS